MHSMARTACAGITILMAATMAATAQSRPDTRSMDCHQVQSLVRDARAIVLTTGQHTYDRYVVSSSYCSRPSVAIPASVPARDGTCRVLRCGQPIFDRRW